MGLHGAAGIDEAELKAAAKRESSVIGLHGTFVTVQELESNALAVAAADSSTGGDPDIPRNIYEGHDVVTEEDDSYADGEECLLTTGVASSSLHDSSLCPEVCATGAGGVWCLIM